MLTAAARAQLAVVLVGARNPANIGAAARAMQDFGFTDLRIVNPYTAPFEAAQLETAQSAPQLLDAPLPKSAVGAANVMAAARRFDHLADAISDCTLVAATTAIGQRGLDRDILSLQQAVLPILTTLHAAHSSPDSIAPTAPLASPPNLSRVALLFGSEKTGLTNDQLSHCSLLLTIPMHAPSAAPGEEAPRHLSMNLGQAVAVCLYELTRQGFENSRELPLHQPAPSTAADRERLTQLLLDVMHSTGYTRRFPAHSREIVVRRLAQHLGDTHDEASTWMGILRQILSHEQPQ